MTLRTLFTLVVPCLAACAAFFWVRMPRLGPAALTPSQIQFKEAQQQEIESLGCSSSEPRKLFWSVFSGEAGASVRGYPVKGGIYALDNCFSVELEFLGLDRFHDVEKPSKEDLDGQAKEEAHCNRMRRLGAAWWRSKEQKYWEEELEPQMYPPPFPPMDRPYLRVGWPNGDDGGVWVLNTTQDKALGMGAGKIHNAHSMEERCQLIEQLGGVFYADPKDCPHLDLP